MLDTETWRTTRCGASCECLAVASTILVQVDVSMRRSDSMDFSNNGALLFTTI